MAFQRGRCLPPVALIQVGDHYFVRDGHHRISVARALGQLAIEATVEVWQVDRPLPWEQLPQALSRKRSGGHEEKGLASIRGWLAGLRPAGRVATSPVAG